MRDLFDSTGFALIVFFKSVTCSRFALRKSKEIIDQLFIAIYASLPLVFITGLFSGLIMAFQIGNVVGPFGQAHIIGSAVPPAILREIGPVFCAIATAGLIGSKYAAEIATMKFSEEIDAIKVMGIDHIYLIVMPRFVALAIAMPILAIFTCFVGIVGGAIVTVYTYDIGFAQYIQSAQDMLKFQDLYVGLIKSFAFGVIVSVITCSQGLKCGYGPEGVGRSVLGGVVGSFVFIIIFDYLITWMFY